MKISRRKASATDDPTHQKDTTKQIHSGAGRTTYRRIEVTVEREILSIRAGSAVKEAPVEPTEDGPAHPADRQLCELDQSCSHKPLTNDQGEST
jgi:hypothetical protein